MNWWNVFRMMLFYDARQLIENVEFKKCYITLTMLFKLCDAWIENWRNWKFSYLTIYMLDCVEFKKNRDWNETWTPMNYIRDMCCLKYAERYFVRCFYIAWSWNLK